MMMIAAATRRAPCTATDSRAPRRRAAGTGTPSPSRARRSGSVATTTIHTSAAGPVAHGASARKAPNPVATPLPPRNAQEDRPAVADDREHGARRRPRGRGIRGARDAHRGVALRDVADEGRDGRALAERPQHVGGADVAAARRAGCRRRRASRATTIAHRESRRSGRRRRRPRAAHGQRSRSLTSALKPVLRKKR